MVGLLTLSVNAYKACRQKNVRTEAIEEYCRRNKKAALLDCCCCGGRTRTCDLQVMSLASYQLLHSAMLNHALFQMRVQRYFFFLNWPNKSLFISKNTFILTISANCTFLIDVQFLVKYLSMSNKSYNFAHVICVVQYL